MRLVRGLGIVGLLFAAFAGMSAFGGRGRDAAESGAAAVIFLGAAAFILVRVVLPRLRDRSRLELLQASDARWSPGRRRRGTILGE